MAAGKRLTAPDPDFAARVRDSFARQDFMTMIGARLVTVEPGRATILLPHRSDLTQQHGLFHGGVTGAIADSAGGYAAFSLFPADASILTVEYKLNLLAPGKGERLEAEGQVIKPGRTLAVTDLKVWAVEGEKRTLIAAGQQTLICLHGRPDR
ncbi:MAG: PaaI family thioesterase [Alphaproteobacteria bacterium]|nr:PaaI family thioesterase [Alphaproteobacteria bacterium]